MFEKKSFIKDLLWTLFLLILATCIAGFDYHFQNFNTVSIYIFSIVLIAYVTNGYFCGILASLLAVLSVNYIFTYPYLSFDFTRNGYPITFLLMSFTALIVNITTFKLKKHAITISMKERRTQDFYMTMKKLVTLKTPPEVETFIVSHLKDYLHTEVAFHFFTNLDQLEVLADSYYYSHLRTPNKYYGTLVIKKESPNFSANEFQQYISVITAQTLLILEQLRLTEEQQKAQLESEREKMRSNLLRAISHDIRTPLTNILGSISTLIDNPSFLDEQTKHDLLSSVQEDCQWLIHMVENLLSITRIREGETKLNTTLEPAEEIIAEAVVQLKKRCPDTAFHVKIPEELLMVPMDATLIKQVIINLAENSVHHSGCPSPIDITLSKVNHCAVFKIRDYGKGLPQEQLNHLFDGYSTSPTHSQDTYKGMGIGLSICMTIIHAHNGTIKGFNNKEETQGGASFIFTLPMEELVL